jgi:hypothetical protein
VGWNITGSEKKFFRDAAATRLRFIIKAGRQLRSRPKPHHTINHKTTFVHMHAPFRGEKPYVSLLGEIMQPNAS